MVDQGAYYFVASDGRRGDIIRCQTHQPGISDPDDYFFYMWVQTLQGYFILKQRFLEGRPQNWSLIGEMTTDEKGPAVFDDWSEILKERFSE
ncbi:MAG: hypothetical protein KC800_28440 [Candidatus Eremiobacteraeota bacterium]|nr:hypothetical protein [Candidatus Eremiobacteraeota bacterium]